LGALNPSFAGNVGLQLPGKQLLNMKQYNFWKVFILSLFFVLPFTNCKKDFNSNLKTPPQSAKNFTGIDNWSVPEQQFFSLEKRNSGVVVSISKVNFIYHPLVIEAYNHIDYFSPKGCHGVPSEGSIPSGTLFPKFSLSSRGKLTDFTFDASLSSYKYLLVSERLLNLSKSFLIDDFQVFDCPIKTRSGFKPYYVLYLCNDRADFINWEDSIFEKRPKAIDWKQAGIDKKMPENNEFEVINGLTEEAYQKLKFANLIRKEKFGIYWDKLPFDLVRVKWPSGKILVSENLKAAIESSGMTGMRFRLRPLDLMLEDTL